MLFRTTSSVTTLVKHKALHFISKRFSPQPSPPKIAFEMLKKKWV